MPFQYEYPHPAVTVDCVLFGYRPGSPLSILLIQRKDEPYKGYWALPGGFVNIEEPIETAAIRELFEETCLTTPYLEQLYTFGDPGRDPRERVIAVAHFALVHLDQHIPMAGSDASRAVWTELSSHVFEELAFDHKQIVEKAIARLRAKIRYEPIAFNLLPDRFTIPELQVLYETVLGKKLDRANFAKQALRLGVLRSHGRRRGPRGRPAVIYSYDQKAHERLRRRGGAFSL